jgi:uncharacterized protein involved in exopolysaccharide biosynthesis
VNPGPVELQPPTEPPRTTWRPPSFEWIAGALLENWRFIARSAAVIVSALFLALIIRGPVYETKAQLLVKLGRSSSSAATYSEQRTVVQSKRPEDVTTEIQILLSQHLLGTLVDEFGVEYFYARPPPETVLQWIKGVASDASDALRGARDALLATLGLRREISRRDKVIAVLGKSIGAEVVNRSDVIELTMRARDPDAGVVVLDRLIDLYIQSHIKAHTSSRVEKFFTVETEKLQQQLKLVEAERAKLRTSTGLWSAGDQRRQLLEWQQQLAAGQAAIQTKAAALKAESDNLERQASREPDEVRLEQVDRRNEVLDKLRGSLSDLTAKKAQLEVRYDPDNRQVRDLQQEIEQTQRAIAAEIEFLSESVTRGPNEQRRRHLGLVTEYRAQLDGLQAQDAKVAVQLRKVATDLRELETREADLRRLDREILRLERDWNLYAKNLGESRSADQMDTARIANVTVITPPTASIYPVAPSIKIAILGSLFLGLGIPAALVLLFRQLRPVATSRADVGQLIGAPVLASLPDIGRNPQG